VRWPFALSFLAVSGIVFLMGIAQNFGYTGTTGLHSMSVADWDAFKSKLFQSDATSAKRGAPYYFSGTKKAPTVSGKSVVFDVRLTKILQYLSEGTDSPKCGTTGRHEQIGLSIDASPASDLSHPVTNAQSSSTVYRGVGVRVVSADRIKCTRVTPYPPDFLTPPIAVSFNAPGFAIPLDGKSIEIKPPVPANSRVFCAVDYYPRDPVYHLQPADITDPRDLTPPRSASIIGLLDPSHAPGSLGTADDYFNYDDYAGFAEFNEKVPKAGIYKTAQLAYEIMHADDAGCDTKEGNKENKRIIPFTVIFPEWVWSDRGFADKGLVTFFLNLSKKSFPFFLQGESPTAGMAYDPLLKIGLHFNY